jgi:RNA polymerase sigma-70 factor, ECF subfamily
MRSRVLSPEPVPPSGERPSFQSLYRQYFANVVSWARWSGVPERNAPDVAQDVFVAVYGALPRLDLNRPIKPWLKTITQRAARDHLALGRNCRERLPGGSFNPHDPISDNAEHRFEIYDAEAIFHEILLSLDEDRRRVFIMHELDEMPQSEIALELGVPETTVRSWLRRACADFDAAVRRRRAKDKRRFAGAVPFPLLEPTALLAAARALPEMPPDVAESIWERVAQATADDIPRKLSGLAALTPPQIAAGLAGALLGGAAAGAGAMFALLHSSSNAPVVAISREIPLALTTAGPASPLLTVSSASPPAVPNQANLANPVASASSARSVGMVAASVALDRRAERDLITHARNALAQGRIDVVVSDLALHARQFPHGALVGDRQELLRTIEARRRAGGP